MNQVNKLSFISYLRLLLLCKSVFSFSIFCSIQNLIFFIGLQKFVISSFAFSNMLYLNCILGLFELLTGILKNMIAHDFVCFVCFLAYISFNVVAYIFCFYFYHVQNKIYKKYIFCPFFQITLIFFTLLQ